MTANSRLYHLPPSSPVTRPKSVVFAAFKGFGDLLAAAPIVINELNLGVHVTLLIFPQLSTFVTLVDFGPNSKLLTTIVLPTPLSLRGYRTYRAEAAAILPEMIWISPHATKNTASWKIPLMMWHAKKTLWPKAVLAGVEGERLPFLFDRLVPTERSLPLMARELRGYQTAAGIQSTALPPRARFVAKLRDVRRPPFSYDVVFHPGASWSNKKWPQEQSHILVADLAKNYRVLVLGLPGEIFELREQFKPFGNVTFLSGSIEEALEAMAKAKIAITMDSGAMHFASALGLRTIALFGPTDPSTIVQADTHLETLYIKGLKCQPCFNSHCTQAKVYCMELLSATTVSAAARAALAKFES